ncbi:MAG: SPOR domain-containing protein [Oleiphilaceae bacterium]|nr:SPOR domain-containing protein [Oleiphilaceae bacterium]
MARKTPPKKSPPRRQPGKPTGDTESRASFGWLLPVAAVSAFIGFIVYLDSQEPDPGPGAPEQPVTTQPAPSSRDSEETQRNFRFYDMLPESSVVTPDVNAYDPGPGAAERNIEFILQTGSFRSEKDAEQQRAQVGLQGLRARISTVSPQPDSTWYRVEVGPYTDRSEMNRAIDRLVSINIQPLVRQRSTEDDKE